MKEAEARARHVLRGYILASGHDDWVPIASVWSCLSRELLGDYAADRMRLVVDTVRALLTEGLAETGDIPGPNDPGFMPWPGTVDEVMTQFVTRFVLHHDDPLGWEYTIWLNLTPAGEQASGEILRSGSVG